MRTSSSICGLLLALLLVALLPLCPSCATNPVRSTAASTETNTVASRLEQYGEIARARLRPEFSKAGIAYPPRQLTFVGLKQERSLQVYAKDPADSWRFVRAYSILGASGHAGPKLREGDHQVPEGIYPIEWLNPNALRHLSMRIGYPNDFDRAQAAKEGRTNLGEDIMIHGHDTSIGCLAMGDEVAEDLFVLAADVGISNITVVLAPVDFRTGRAVDATNNVPAWTDRLYEQVRARLAELPLETR